MRRRAFLRIGAVALVAIPLGLKALVKEEYTLTNIEGDMAWDQDGKWVWDSYVEIDPTMFGWRRRTMEEWRT